MTGRPFAILPEKPSALIRLALADLEIVSKMDDYIIDMDVWHQPIGLDPSSSKTKCAVCFAGSVMANTLNSSKHKPYNPYDFDHAPTGVNNSSKLIALNEFRVGCINLGLKVFFDGHFDKFDHYTGPTEINVTPTNFRRKMLAIAKLLEEFNL